MTEKNCCIYGSDEGYVMRLSEAMNNSVDIPYRVIPYTSKDALIEFSNGNEITILIECNQIEDQVISKLSPQYIFVLDENKTDLDNKRICKYQSVEGIIKALQVGLADGGIVFEKNNFRMTMVYSPGNPNLRNALAIGYAIFKSKSEKVLYINLDEFAVLDNIFDKGEKDLSDALLYFIDNKENRMSKILNCTSSKYGIDYIYPASCPEDIGIIDANILYGFLGEIEKSGIYSEVVVDMGTLMANPWESMPKYDGILMPQPIGEADTERTNKFISYIDKSKYRAIKNSIKMVQIGCSRDVTDGCLNLSVIENCDIERGIQEVING